MKRANNRLAKLRKNWSSLRQDIIRDLTKEYRELSPKIVKYLLLHFPSIVKVFLFAIVGLWILQKGYYDSVSILVSQKPLVGYSETTPVQIKTREKGTNKYINNLEFNIDLLPLTKAQTRSSDILLGSSEDDILVKIETANYVPEAVEYEIVWPGKVDFPLAAELFGDLKVEIMEQTDSFTRMKVDNTLGLPREAYSDDYFFFFWKNGKETVNFSDREIRLKIDYPIQLDYVQITFLSAEQIIQEVPLPEKIEVDAIYDGITHYYKGKDLIVIYTDAEKKSEGQYRLIISGILLSAGTTLLLQAFIDLFDLLKQFAQIWAPTKKQDL